MQVCKISQLCYTEPIDGLPDPRGSLFSARPLDVIAEANKEVQKAACGVSPPDCPECNNLGTRLEFYLYATRIKQQQNLTGEYFCR